MFDHLCAESLYRSAADTDDDGDGTGAYFEPKVEDNEGLWWAYIVAER